MAELSNIEHPFEPIYDENSTVLILGTMPSVKSRQAGFYYANPRNAFWRLIAHICDAPVPMTVEEKKELLHKNHIAIWDVCKSCDIKNSDDSTIKNAVPTDIPSLIKKTKIKRIYGNSKKAADQYNRYVRKDIGIDIVPLTSSSSASCRVNEEYKKQEWKELIELD